MSAFNEKVAIRTVALETKCYANRVIVVDGDNSARTAEVAELAGAKVIQYHQNKKKGATIKTQFEPLNYNSGLL